MKKNTLASINLLYKQNRLVKKIFWSCVVKAGKGEHSVEFAERPNQQIMFK